VYLFVIGFHLPSCDVIVGSVMLMIEKTAVPTRRGFFCADETIRYPNATQPTFSSKSLAAICLFITFITVTIICHSLCSLQLFSFKLAFPPHLFITPCSYISFFDIALKTPLSAYCLSLAFKYLYCDYIPDQFVFKSS